jgi:hypothetical protein
MLHIKYGSMGYDARISMWILGLLSSVFSAFWKCDPFGVELEYN